jgi:hypothetical protein
MNKDEYLNGSQLLYQLLDNNIEEVKLFLEEGGDANIDLKFQFKFIHPSDSYEKIFDMLTTPLEIAIPRLYYELVELLVQFGANIIDKLEYAVRTDDEKMIRLVVKLGAKLDIIDNVGKSAYEVAFYHKCYKAMSILMDLGLSVKEYGGNSFRNAASKGDFTSAEFFYKNGVDINYNKPDMVYSYASTAITEAARHNNFEMVKWLVERDADITISDKYGKRPYTCAVRNKNTEMAKYLKQFEPAEWHNEQDKLRQLSNYKLPKEMVDFLKGDKLRIDYPDGRNVKYICFYSFLDTVELEWDGKKVLSLAQEVGNCDIMIVWSPKERKVCYLDTEHETLLLLCTWKEFIKDAGYYINGVWDGMYR